MVVVGRGQGSRQQPRANPRAQICGAEQYAVEVAAPCAHTVVGVRVQLGGVGEERGPSAVVPERRCVGGLGWVGLGWVGLGWGGRGGGGLDAVMVALLTTMTTKTRLVMAAG